MIGEHQGRNENVAVGGRLRLIRMAAGFRRPEVVRQLGLAQGRIERLEIGSQPLLFSEAVAFAVLYRVPLRSFIEELPPNGERGRRRAKFTPRTA